MDQIEPLVWREIERVLSDPALIMAELERLEHAHGATTSDLTKERQALQKALAALEREAHRWDEAYAHEVIDLTELKAKKLDIAERTQWFLAQQATAEAAMHAAQQAQAHARDILLYCQHVTAQLQILDAPTKRQALEALDIRVRWTPGEPIQIAGSIPIGNIVYSAPRRTGSSRNTAPGICVV